MSLDKKILAAAVIGALYATGASAQFNLATTTTPLRYAAELTKPASIIESAGNQLAFDLMYNFTDGEVRHARIECTSNLTFLSPIVESVTPANAAVIGSMNSTANAVFFSIGDPPGGGATALATTTVALGVAGTNTAPIYSIANNAPVVCSYSLYDQPSQAQAGGTVGRIVSVSRTFIEAAPSFVFSATLGTSPTASVEAANGAYFGFLGTDRSIGSYNLALVTTPPLNANGVAVALADMFGANTAVHITGDTTGFTTLSGHDSTDGCTTSTTAFNTFTIATAGLGRAFHAGGASATPPRFVCFTASGTAAIQEGSYSATLMSHSNSSWTVPNVGPLPIGSIVRDGTQIQAPLVQTPNGFISRVALTNTGTVDRSFTWTFRPALGSGTTEADTVYTGPHSGMGIIPANGVRVLSLVELLGTAATNFNNTPPRGVFTVSAAAPTTQIQGLYQIVNPANGAISNHVMVRPGSN